MDYAKLFQFFTQLFGWALGTGGFVKLTSTTATTSGSLAYDTKASGTLGYDNSSGTFTNGETITGGTSAATAIVVSKTSSVFTLRAIIGTFQNNEQVTGGTSGKTADVNGTVTYFDFEESEVITGGTGGATATVLSADGTTLDLSDISGIFQNNELITGSVSAATALANGVVAYAQTGGYYILKVDGAADLVLERLVQQDGTVTTSMTIYRGTELKGSFTDVRITSGIVYAYPKPF